MGPFIRQRLGIEFKQSIVDCRANHWLNAIILENSDERDYFLKLTNEKRFNVSSDLGFDVKASNVL